MKKSLVVLTLSLCCSAVFAKSDPSDNIYISDNKLERVSIEWVEPKKFSDVKQANFSSAKFRKHVFKQLENHIDELAKQLPKGQTLQVSVEDLDLAGRLEPASLAGLGSSMQDVRVMRTVDIPRMTFTYSLLDANESVLKTETVKLKDMNYLTSSSTLRDRDRPFGHEKRMLSAWFKKNLVKTS